MKTGKAGIDLLKQFEGIVMKNGMAVPYICPTGHPTIGWGCTFDVKGDLITMQNKPISLMEAEQLLANVLSKFEDAVNRLVKVPLTQNQFDALVCFTFNLGEGNLGASTLLKQLNAKNYQGAADQFLVWNKGKVNGKLVEVAGLTKRRKAERDLFMKK